MDVFISYAWTFFLIVVLGLGVGGYNERRHLRSLSRREGALKDSIRVNNLKRIVQPETVTGCELVLGQSVIATDYFKTFAVSLRNLLGGEMRTAQTLLRRARREALTRMLEDAVALGATEVWNVRFGFSNIGMMRGKRGAMQVEVLAYGTAVTRGCDRPEPAEPIAA